MKMMSVLFFAIHSSRGVDVLEGEGDGCAVAPDGALVGVSEAGFVGDRTGEVVDNTGLSVGETVRNVKG